MQTRGRYARARDPRGELPCAEFGANAWFSINALTYDVLSALKTSGLPPALHDARPKRLRLRVLHLPAQLVSHARSLFARIGETLAAGVQLLSTASCKFRPTSTPMHPRRRRCSASE